MSTIKYEPVEATLADVKPGEVFHFEKQRIIGSGATPTYFMTAHGTLYSLHSDEYFDAGPERPSRPVLVYRPVKVYFPVVGTVIASASNAYVRVGPDKWTCTNPKTSSKPLTDDQMFYHNDPEASFRVVYEPDPPVHLLGDQDEG